MRRRDFVVFSLICVFLWITLQHEGSISFEKCFFFEHKQNRNDLMFDGGQGMNHHHGHTQKHSTTLPKPVITDLDQDGSNEMLVASDQGHVKLIRLNALKKASSAIHPKYFTILPEEKIFDVDAHVKSDSMTHLGHKFREQIDQNKIHVVGMEAGFRDHLNSTSVRKQIVVVVLSDWRILCFDHELNLLWENSLVEERGNYGTPGEVAISIVPYRVHEGDRGMVIIGLYNHLPDSEFHTSAKHRIYEEQEFIEKTKHYSYYALNAGNGHRRWKHESTDFLFHHEGERLIPQHNHKMDAYQHLEHSGEVPWIMYKTNVLQQLPHIFRHEHDTLFSVEHFNATTLKAKKTISTDRDHVSVKKLKEITSSLKAVKRTRKPKILHSTPNVLVAHLSKGIEVIHLYTGRTLCQLAPLKQDAAYADLNGDGIIDVVEEDSCTGSILTGFPSLIEPVFRSNICKMKGGSIAQFYLGQLEASQSNELLSEEEQYESVTPAIIEYYSDSGTIKDALFFVESGLVTAVTPDQKEHFKIKWQSSTPSKFNKKHEKNDEWYFAEIRPYAVRKLEHDRYILSVGESFLTVLDLHGSTQQVIPLPEPIIAPLLLSHDVNGDGLNDIIMITRKGVYAFRARSRTGLSVVSVLVISLFVLVSIMYLSTMINLKDPDYVKKPKDM
jgi:hypothetical protein